MATTLKHPDMKRKEFLKKAALGGLSLSLLGGATQCTTASGSGAESAPCTETPEAEEGPFPTKEPSRFVTKNIISNKPGAALTIRVEVFNINNKCLPLPNAIVDVWHCDHAGEYSEYGGGGFGPPPGGNIPPPPGGRPGERHRPGDRPRGGGGPGMQGTDHTDEHFLRGRQMTDAQGIASFSSIYPGWYGGRAPHIHVHIFDEKEKSLLICQIAFPDKVSKAVYAQGVYAPRGQSDRSNENDHVFRDSIANELAVVTGNLTEGFVLTHSIYVKA